ncbi:MAG: class I SAM-dependent methyltransferase [Ignavibacteriales bacterium]|nr:class I SAM-dependent methyltransferase [Ignavibacteriales bacterium]
MLNLIHPYDILKLFEKIQEQNAFKILSRIVSSNEGKVKSTWKHTTSEIRSWTEIPAVQLRINKKISNDDNIDHYTYAARKYFCDGRKRIALSLGCGAGGNEILWAKTASFSHIDAIDISAPRIESAKQKALTEHLDSILRFRVGDVHSVFSAATRYDVIIAEGILHHITPLRDALRSIKSLLKDDGLLIINDFVGPSRFQWTQQQLDESNLLLSSFPERLKIQHNGNPKRKIHRPGLIPMYLYDPSEAVESHDILKFVEQNFSVVEKKEYGGTILHLVFKDIAHHFVQPDDEAQTVLHQCFSKEDELLLNLSLKSDFVFLVCKK